jgi:hypothetical protein
MAHLILKNHSAEEKFLTLPLARSPKPLPLLMQQLWTAQLMPQLKLLQHGAIVL